MNRFKCSREMITIPQKKWMAIDVVKDEIIVKEFVAATAFL